MCTCRFTVSATAVVLAAAAAVGIADPVLRRAIPEEYTIVDLGTLGGLASNAHDLNEQGQVVGEADTTGPWRRAFLWEDGVMTDLGTLPPIDQTVANSVNNLGQVVGMASETGGMGRAFIWEDGEMVELGDHAIAKTAYAINDAGQVAGIAGFSGEGTHAFLFEDDVLTDLGTLGGMVSLAWDINEVGQVVGQSFTGAGERAFLWSNDVMIDLGNLGIGNSNAYGINDLGQVVGKSHREIGDKLFHAFLWEDGEMTDIGAIGGFESSRAEDINNAGQIVGEPSFLYDPVEGMIDLEDRLPFGSGWAWIAPRAINDAGQIAGRGSHDGVVRGFLMTPVIPEIPAVSSVRAAVLVALFVVIGSVFALRAKRTG